MNCMQYMRGLQIYMIKNRNNGDITFHPLLPQEQLVVMGLSISLQLIAISSFVLL